ncbi:MAG: Flp pilus assembly complex ATPase component TadA [Candidatus Hydrogenedentes bacterium]|nr:Flp pilus assembly complex ATPase component TadA [Candidatus Hydrogenedentota bacterium]
MKRTRSARTRRIPGDAGKPPRRNGQAEAAEGGGLLSMAQAIELLKTTRSTFYRWLRAGRLNGMKVGRQWRFDRGEIERFLHGEEPRIALRSDILPLAVALEERAAELGAPPLAAPEDSEVARAAFAMIRLGMALEASDLHVHPHVGGDGHTRSGMVRYRVDGVLHPSQEFDIRLLPPLVAYWKRLAGCNPQESGRPQYGVLIHGAGEGRVEVRASFVPSVIGESVTGRLLSAHAQLDLDALGYAPSDLERLTRSIEGRSGLIVLDGPVGSGKSMSMYACLGHLAGPGVKVVSVEDPVERLLPWVEQTQVSEREGLGFARAAVSFLRSDADVIALGEIRDNEALELCLQASLTGHVVLTTLHAGRAAKALRRMIEIGAPPFVVADATTLIVSQRLVRALCPHCSKEGEIPGETLARAERLCRGSGLDWDVLPKTFRRTTGCAKCRDLGYRGRLLIAETLSVTPRIGEALRRGASAEELQALAVDEGMKTMAADGIGKAVEGATTIEEVLRTVAAG